MRIPSPLKEMNREEKGSERGRVLRPLASTQNRIWEDFEIEKVPFPSYIRRVSWEFHDLSADYQSQKRGQGSPGQNPQFEVLTPVVRSEASAA